ncbi:hypothetical protein H8959_009706 [Pygathrix nigripes]
MDYLSLGQEHSIGQKHQQEEIIHKLAMQLRHIGDSIDHRMVRELRGDPQWVAPLCRQVIH